MAPAKMLHRVRRGVLSRKLPPVVADKRGGEEYCHYRDKRDDESGFRAAFLENGLEIQVPVRAHVGQSPQQRVVHVAEGG